jgi:hypothetical protein
MLMDINGDVGTGKTTLAVKLVSDWYRRLEKKELLPSGKNNILTRANFDLNFPYFDFLEPQDLLDLEPSKTGTTVVIDEAYTWLESRISMSKLNRFMSYITFQSRKRDLDIIATEQLRSTIDLRFKDMSNFTVFGFDRPNPKTSTEPFEYRIIKNSIMRYRDFVFPYKKAKELFGLFKTEQVIMPPDIEDLKADMIASNPQSLNKSIDLIVKEVKEKLPEVFNRQVKEVTHDFVNDLLLRLEKPLAFESFVYVRLRSQIQQQQKND